MPVLTNIRTTYGDNYGGIQYFRFAPKEWLMSDFMVNKSTGFINVQLNLIPNRFWLTGVPNADSVAFTEEMKDAPGGKVVQANLTGTILKADLARNLNVNEMLYREFIVVVMDNNKKVRVLGNKRKGMSLLSAYTSDTAPGDASMYNLSFSLQSAEHAPFYIHATGTLVLGNNGGLSTTVGNGGILY